MYVLTLCLLQVQQQKGVSSMQGRVVAHASGGKRSSGDTLTYLQHNSNTGHVGLQRNSTLLPASIVSGSSKEASQAGMAAQQRSRGTGGSK